ncbi:MAG: hypothetical protein FWC97_11395 [Treponema sp.]|nr:hypothetical protein [Treponema sp.]
MTITQTVEIPSSRSLIINVPREVPTGATVRLELKVIPFDKKEEKPPTLRLTKKELDGILRTAQTPISDSLTGILSNLGDITAEQIREERLAKYL